MPTKRPRIYVTFEYDDEEEMLNHILRERGLTSKSKMVCILIREEYKRLQKKSKREPRS